MERHESLEDFTVIRPIACAGHNTGFVHEILSGTLNVLAQGVRFLLENMQGAGVCQYVDGFQTIAHHIGEEYIELVYFHSCLDDATFNFSMDKYEHKIITSDVCENVWRYCRFDKILLAIRSENALRYPDKHRCAFADFARLLFLKCPYDLDGEKFGNQCMNQLIVIVQRVWYWLTLLQTRCIQDIHMDTRAILKVELVIQAVDELVKNICIAKHRVKVAYPPSHLRDRKTVVQEKTQMCYQNIQF